MGVAGSGKVFAKLRSAFEELGKKVSRDTSASGTYLYARANGNDGMRTFSDDLDTESDGNGSVIPTMKAVNKVLDGLQCGSVNLLNGSRTMDTMWFLTDHQLELIANRDGGMWGPFASRPSSGYTDVMKLHFPYQPDYRYVLSFFSSCHNNENKGTFQVVFPDGVVKRGVTSQGQVLNGNGAFTFQVSGSSLYWIKISTTSTTKGWKDVAVGRLYPDAANPLTLGIYAMKLEVGDVLSDWTPAFEDKQNVFPTPSTDSVCVVGSATSGSTTHQTTSVRTIATSITSSTDGSAIPTVAAIRAYMS